VLLLISSIFLLSFKHIPSPPAPQGSQSLAICTAGTVIGFGSNSACQVGDGSSSITEPIPVATSGISNIVAVSAGADFSLALDNDGTVWAWEAEIHTNATPSS